MRLRPAVPSLSALGLFAIAAVTSACAVGCKKKTLGVRVQVTTIDDAYVTIEVDIIGGIGAARVTIDEVPQVDVNAVDRQRSVKLPLWFFKPGSHTLHVRASELRGDALWTGAAEVTFDRKPLQPMLKVTGVVAAESVPVGEPLGEPTLVATGDSIAMSNGSDAFFVGSTANLQGDDKLPLTFESAPGSVVTVGDERVPIKSDGLATYVVDLAPQVADADLDVLGSPRFFSLPMRVSSPDGLTRDGSVLYSSSAIATLARARLEKVTQGPVLFGDGAASPPGSPKVLELLIGAGGAGGTMTRFGAAGRVRDVDLVAIWTAPAERTLGQCGPYGAVAGAESHFYDHTAQDEEVVVYDRRTGKIRTRRTFYASGSGCPDSIVSYDGSASVRDTVEPDVVVAWVKTLVPAPAVAVVAKK